MHFDRKHLIWLFVACYWQLSHWWMPPGKHSFIISFIKNPGGEIFVGLLSSSLSSSDSCLHTISCLSRKKWAVWIQIYPQPDVSTQQRVRQSRVNTTFVHSGITGHVSCSQRGLQLNQFVTCKFQIWPLLIHIKLLNRQACVLLSSPAADRTDKLNNLTCFFICFKTRLMNWDRL